MAAGSQHRCVFVGNIPYDTTEEQLVQICEEVGPVVSFRLVIDRETGKPKGYGFCEYKDEETALSARRNLQGYEINGRQLRVDFAENDKGTNRNKDQGRGGPGLASNIDTKKSLGGPSVSGDVALHQPIGLPIAASAASLMAGALGGAQIASTSAVQSALSGQSGFGNDPLTHYLAKMSRYQLNEMVVEMKDLATQNKALTRQLLLGSPQFSKSLFQAQIILGMVSPEMLQMASNKLTSGSAQKPSQNLQDRNEALLPHPRPTTSLERQVGLAPRPPLDILPTAPALRAHPLGVPSQMQRPPLIISQGLLTQIQPPVMQHLKPLAPGTSGLHPHATPRDPNSSTYPVLASGMDKIPREIGTAFVNFNSPWDSRMNANPNYHVDPEYIGISSSTPELIHPSKLAKLNDGSSASPMQSNNTSRLKSNSVQSVATGSFSSNLVNADGMERSEKVMLEFPPDVESALWKQVMGLTAEQLSLLPQDQQEQVIQLQKALQKQITNTNPGT